MLFLMEDGSGFKGAARYGGIDVATAWIKKDKAYARVQVFNPGSPVMIDVGDEKARCSLGSV